MLLIAGLALAMPGSAYGFAADEETSQSHLEEAREYFDDKEFQAAVIELRNALKADPDNLEARILLTEIYLLAGQGIAAQTEVEDIRDRGGSHEETAIYLARSHLIQNNYDAVIAALDEVEIPEDQVDDALVLRGDAAAAQGDTELAEEQYKAAIAANEDSAEARLGLSRLYLRLGRIDEAEATVEEALAIEPTRAVLHHVRGLVARAKGNQSAAVEHFSESIEANPGAVAPRLDRAASLIDLDRIEEAQIDIDEVDRLAPDNAMKEYLRAVVLARQEEFEGANSTLANVGDALNNFLPAVMLNGYVSYQIGNFQQAADHLSRLVSRAPQHVPGRQLYAASLLQNGNPQDALVALQPLLDQEETDARTKVLAGTAFMQTGEFQQGVEMYQAALEQAPDADALRTQLAVGRFALGEAETAIADLEYVIEQGNDPLRAAIMLTLIERQEGNFEAALKSANSVIDQIPDQPVGYNLAGAVQAAAGEAESARQHFKQALEKDQNYHVARINLADLEARQGNLDAAERELSYVLDQDTDNVNAMVNLARVMVAKDNNQRALELVERAVLQRPNSVQVRRMLIESHLRAGDVDAALEAARDAERDFSNNTQIIDLLGRILVMRGDFDRAATTYGRLINLDPENPRSYLRYGSAQRNAGIIEGARLTLLRGMELANERESNLAALILVELIQLEGSQQNFEEALGYYNELESRYPDVTLNPVSHGQLLLSTQRYDEAIELYSSLLEEPEENPIAVRGGLFQALRGAGQTEQALDMAQEWVDQNPDLNAARLFLADAHLALENFDEAAEQYEQLLEDEPENTTVLNNLAWSYHQMGQARAITYAERAYETAPDNPQISDTLGWIMLQNGGDERRALALIEEAALKLPTNPEVNYHLAAALNAVGRTSEAREKLERLLDSADDFPQRDNARQLLASLRE